MNEMNRTFNLKRFLLLERYKGLETGKHLLWSGGIVLSICVLCILYDINRGGSYYGKFTSAGNLCQYILYFLFAAPCLLETNLSKHTATLDMLLPASTFEKFMHIWIKYFLLLPIFCVLVLLCLKIIFLISSNFFLQFFAEYIFPCEIKKEQILTYCILQSVCFTGFFAFKRQLLLKSFAVFVIIIAISIGIVLLAASLMPDTRPEGYWLNNITAWPKTNYPLSATTQAIVTFCNYAAPICVVLGSWISSYFLLKEKQL